LDIGTDATVSVPLWTLFGGLSTVIGMTWWIFTTFYRKTDARELESSLRADIGRVASDNEDRAGKLSERIDRMDGKIDGVAIDVSYLRGRAEVDDR
jgi:hypothetical protein